MVQPPQAVLREIVGVVNTCEAAAGRSRRRSRRSTCRLRRTRGGSPRWSCSLRAGRQKRSRQRSAPRSRASSPIGRVRFRTLTDDSHAGHVAAPLPRRARRRVRRAGVDAGARRRLRRARLLGAAAHARVRRAHRARRKRGERAAARHLERGVVIGSGVAIGLAVAALVSRSISTFLFGVQPIDPITFVLVPLVLSATAAIAVAAPAWRAARVDPVVAFRQRSQCPPFTRTELSDRSVSVLVEPDTTCSLDDEALTSLVAVACPTRPGSRRRARVPHRDAHARTGRARHGSDRPRARSCCRASATSGSSNGPARTWAESEIERCD